MYYIMNEIINQFVNNLPFEMHLYDSKVGKYSACGPGTKHSERLEKYKKTGDVSYIFKNELDKACFFHDAGYNKVKTADARIPYDKRLIDDTLKILSNPDVGGYQKMYAAMINKFFTKKIGGGILADKLHKPVRRKFARRRVISYGIDRIWATDLVEMQQFSRWNKGYKYLLMVIDVFSKYGWIEPLKDKRGQTVAAAFKKLFQHRKPNLIWSDKGSEFYNQSLKQLLDKHNIELYSTQNEEKSSVVERWNRTIKTKMWKRFTDQNSTKYLDLLPELVNEYNNTKHSSIKMTPVEASKKENEGIVYFTLYGDLKPPLSKPKFKVGDKVRISKYKRKVFDKGYTPNWTEEIFIITQVMKTNPHTYKLKDLNNEPITGTFYEQELQKTSQTKFRIEKVIRKDYKKKLALVKWKGYSSSFNSWVPLKDLEKL